MNQTKTNRIARRAIISLALTLGGLCATASAIAQTYPNHTVRIVLGFPPGGALDTIARVIAPKLSADLGQPVVIENKAGAGGVIGMQSVARAEPDGYTVFMGTMGNFSITPALVKDLPYNVSKDFAPVTQVASSGFMLYVNAALPIKTVADLVAYAKANPGKTNFSSSGNGGLPHMAAEMFASAAGIKMTHVPYKGSAPSVNDLLAGQVQLTFEAAAIGLPHVKAGKLRAVATTGSRRLDVFPGVPTVAETIAGFDVTNWFGMAVPAKTPTDRITRLNQSVVKALKDPEIKKRLESLGVNPVGDSPQEFGAYIQSQFKTWQKVINDANIKL